jgi:AraC-like DNA-binding protein
VDGALALHAAVTAATHAAAMNGVNGMPERSERDRARLVQIQRGTGPRACFTDAMKVTTIPPGARLAPFVERFTIVESAAEVTRVLLPDRGLVLGVRYRGAATQLVEGRALRLAGSALTGLLPSARWMRTHADSGIVLAQFRPAGAARFFAVPLHELFGATVPLDALMPRGEVDRLAERVAAQPGPAQRIAVIEQFLLARMTADADPIAGAAAAALERARGSLRISALAGELRISQDALEKRFRRAVGASPKQLASLLRAQHAIELGRSGATWSRVAHQAGYFDQSHMIRELRAIAGEAPARFFRSAEYCGPP